MRTIKPKKLKKNGVIGIISPASSPEDITQIEKGVRYLERLGYRTKIGKNVGKSSGYLAGSDEERVKDLHEMFKDKIVDAIICVRGGYGAFRILDLIDYKIIKNNPKIFVGFSEITALQIAILQKTGLITFAGPMLASNLSGKISSFTEDHFWKSITSNKKAGRIKLPNNSKLPGINKGNASGRIIGGNLAVFGALFGTEYFPNDLKNKILLLEDIGEVPYKIDRLMNQLRLAKVFKKINGMILGRFVDCYEHDPSKNTLTLGEVMDNYLNRLSVPIVYTFPHGHIEDMVTVPIGINVKLNATKGFVEFNESGVK
ncbi:MAG: LD-carboxypeptidase [Ignavibacteria bacterium]|nr:LD-carboxypeptidase [Ignavibacteria bacterium]MBT8381129.1 LD-carboxypeptidase [Ignavibacteria bacterium]MBT8392814.1 LD-carboxypeptidase [Ignavibacteria bacterium]NNL22114.1 LD-carboxypeptidase [Ignavibacteriaceae bacterium]